MPGRSPLLWLCAALVPACSGPRWYYQESIVEQRYVTVQIEVFEDGSTPVDQRFAHPVAVDAARLETLLDTLRYRSRKSTEPGPILEPGLGADLARGISRGLAAANPASRVRFQCTNPARTLWVFNNDRTTRGVAFVTPAGTLNLAFDVVDEELTEEGDGFRDPIRRTISDAVLMVPDGAAAHVGADGQVDPLWLMVPMSQVAFPQAATTPPAKTPAEAAPPAAPPPVEAPAPEQLPKLTPEQVLERLRLLEELYRDGTLSQEEFSRRRAELLGIPPP